MDDLLLEFLTETNESLDVVDVELVKFEQEPNNAQILDNVFRLVHTIKGTCGFLGLSRLEALAHAAETLMGRFRDGEPVTPDAVTLILASIDRIKGLLAELEATGAEPAGEDRDLICDLERMAGFGGEADAGGSAEEEGVTSGDLVYQVLERELRPGEVSLDDLERAFRETEGPADFEMPAAVAAAAVQPEPDAANDVKADEAAAPGAETGETSASVSNQSIRVNLETLEHLMTMVSELVLTRNQLLDIARRQEDSEFKMPLQRLSNVTAELQDGVMKTRMQPIGNAWQKLPRIVRDLAREVDKQIELEMHGAETELDRQVLELIKDPLTHMVRNSADHGLETANERIAAGKPAKGVIRLSAYHQGGYIIIEIADDGRGLDTEKLKAKALERGTIGAAEIDKLSEAQIHKFIFHAGFSTAAKVTNVSGRGVGLDVVRNNIELIGGTVDLKSAAGKGTTFTIKIPLTLAIVSALIVEVAGDRFAIPQMSVVELVRAQPNSEHRIERIKDTPVLRLRNKLLPLVHMGSLLGIGAAERDEADPDSGFIVVMLVGAQTFGIIVDSVFHTEEIVVKPMSSMLRDIPMFSGNTILGDGSVIMIIDPNGVAQALGSAAAEDIGYADRDEDPPGADEQETMSLLIFHAGSNEPKAVPLSLVTRLEEFETDRIEQANGRDLVQYRGRLMPLICIDENIKRRTEGLQPMLVFCDSGHSMALVVDDIVDIVDDRLNIEVKSEIDGILGSAVVNGRATDIIDVGHYMPLAFDDWLMRKDMQTEALTRPLLFVDDSAFFRNMLTPVLTAAGYAVTVCDDAEAALAQLRGGGRFDIIVSDIEMPGMNGFDFVEAVKAQPKWQSTPVIALSALATPAAIERGRQAGFDDFVAKFDRPGLIAAIKAFTVELGEAA